MTGLLALLLVVPVLLIRAAVIATLLGWFAVPLGFPAVTAAQVAGIGLAWSVWTLKDKELEESPSIPTMRDFLTRTLTKVLWFLMALGYGAILHWLVP